MPNDDQQKQPFSQFRDEPTPGYRRPVDLTDIPPMQRGVPDRVEATMRAWVRTNENDGVSEK